MKKPGLFSLLFILLLPNLCFSQTDSIVLKSFTVNELKEDYKYWRNRIERKHPLAYYYSSKDVIDACFDSLYQGIDRPMTELEFISLLTPVLSLIQDGHNYVVPSETALAGIRNYKYLFPLELKCINEKLYIIQDLSDSKEPLTGLEITAINNVSTRELLNTFLSNLGRDGNNLQYAFASINKNFRYYYHTYFGFTRDFSIAYRSKDKRELTCTIQGRSLDAIHKEKANRYPIRENKTGSGLKLELVDSIQTAVMSIQTFSPNTNNKQFKKEISSYFEVIKNNDVHHLIIDLRDNGGGNPNLVKFVLQHLFDEAFEQAQACRIVKNSHKEILHERTKKIWYPWYGIGTFKAKRNNYKGKIYVLVNEGTYSAGVIFASVLQKYNRAVFVGNETGGNPLIMGGYLIKTSWKLPNTKIQIGTGTLCTIYGDLALNKGRGLIPDHIIKKTVDDILSSNDRQLSYTLELIGESLRSMKTAEGH